MDEAIVKMFLRVIKVTELSKIIATWSRHEYPTDTKPVTTITNPGKFFTENFSPLRIHDQFYWYQPSLTNHMVRCVILPIARAHKKILTF